MSQLKRLTNPYRAVFRSYRQRPLFWALAAMYLAYPIERLTLAFSHVSPNFNTTFFVIRDVVLYLCDPLYQLFLPIMFAVACMTHLRQQLSGPARMLVPNYSKPHLRVAAFVFFLAALLLPITPIFVEFLYRSLILSENPTTFIMPIPVAQWAGRYAIAVSIVLTLMTIAAWFASFVTSWTAVVLAPIIFIAMLATNFNPWWAYERMFDDFFRGLPLKAVSLGYFIFTIGLPVIALGLTLLFNLFALSALWRRLQRITAKRLVEEPLNPRTPADHSHSIPLCQETLPTRWSRIRHLRSAGITLAAPWIVAVLLAAILMLIAPLLLNGNRPYMQMQISLILATILPSVAVTLLWADRWPRLSVESLLPSNRRQFIIGIFSAIAIDLLYFWVALSIAAVLPLVLVPAAPLNVGILATWLLSSGIMQILAFAIIIWATWLRSWPTLAALLCVVIGTLASPLTVSTRTMPLISIPAILPLIASIAIIGIAVSATAYHRWLRGNWV